MLCCIVGHNFSFFKILFGWVSININVFMIVYFCFQNYRNTNVIFASISYYFCFRWKICESDKAFCQSFLTIFILLARRVRRAMNLVNDVHTPCYRSGAMNLVNDEHTPCYRSSFNLISLGPWFLSSCQNRRSLASSLYSLPVALPQSSSPVFRGPGSWFSL